MTDIRTLAAITEIRRVKARYWRGVDTGDAALVRSILDPDSELDYRGCCTDPTSGRDYVPSMNVVVRGHDAFGEGVPRSAMTSVHQGHHDDIELVDDHTATGIWAFTDHLYFPAGAPYTELTGFGYYHDRYTLIDGSWLLTTTRIARLRVEAR